MCMGVAARWSDEGGGYLKVEGSGEFDVLTVALNQADAMTEMFHHRGIVGEGIRVRLTVGTFQ